MRSSDRDGRNCVLEDQLLLVVGFKYDRIFIERANPARKFYSTHQINRDAAPLLTRRVKEGILNILRRRLILHCRSPWSATLTRGKNANGPAPSTPVQYGVSQ